MGLLVFVTHFSLWIISFVTVYYTGLKLIMFYYCLLQTNIGLLLFITVFMGYCSLLMFTTL